MPKYVIGIDPDLVKSGVAVTNCKQIMSLDSLLFFDLIRFIDRHIDDAFFVLEDVEHDKTVYHRRGTSQAGMRRISQNVGQVKAIGRLIGDYLQGAGADFSRVKPLQGGIKRAKKDADYFNQLTGWVGRSNQDVRDAALLALYGPTHRSLQLG